MMGNSSTPSLRLPNFLICGAPRAATTWLCHALDLHPEIYLAKPFIPEPKFFHRDEIYAKGIEYYSSQWFAGAAHEKWLLGEKTSYYLENVLSPKRIHRHLPQTKLVFMLRDPVERAFSNYLWSVRNGLETEGFEKALDMEAQRTASLPEKWRQVRPFSYFDRGLYAKHLRPYFALFPKEQIICIKSERVGRDPNGLMADLLAFLGTSKVEMEWKSLGKINSALGNECSTMNESAYARLVMAYSEPQKELVDLLGDEFATW